MRTTLDISDDVLQAVRELAVREKSTAGSVLSRLARKGLQTPSQEAFSAKNPIPIFPLRTGELVTLDHVQRLMDEEGI